MGLEKSLEWGEDYQGRIYSPGLACSNKECKDYLSDYGKQGVQKYFESIIVGVRYDSRRKERSRPYIFVGECPKCFDRFWFHISEDMAKEFVKLKDSDKK